MIATTFFATPNTIDFDKVWGQFQAENAAVYGTLIALVVLFIILAVLLRRKDKADMLKVSGTKPFRHMFCFAQYSFA